MYFTVDLVGAYMLKCIKVKEWKSHHYKIIFRNHYKKKKNLM